MISRRTLMTGAAAGGTWLALGGRLWAATEATLGDATVTTLSDGHLTLPESFIYGELEREAVDKIIAAAGARAGGLEPPCNLTLLRRGSDVVLFDAGSGPSFMASAGRLPEAMAAAGVSPEEVTHVVFTHAHPDHLWGVLDDFDEPVFRNAQHLMGADETAYWGDPETAETIAPERQSFAAGALRRIDMLGERLATFGDGETIVPGVTAVLTPGHTPGHMSFEISGGDRRLFVIGDAIGNGHVALAQPAWHAPADQNPELGAETRVALLNRLAEEEAPAVGFHLPGGGLGRIVRDGDAFGWVAE